ncbi:MAG TPA: paraquat-inducible protein A [Rhodanobacteraceae bacterium]
MLARYTEYGNTISLACAMFIIFLLPVAAFLPLMDSTFYDVLFGESRLVSSVGEIYSEVWFPFAFGFLFFALLFPWIRAILQVIVLSGLRIPQRGRIFRFSEELRIWCMPEVVVIAGYVAYYRASISSTIGLQIGALCYIAVAIFDWLVDHAMNRRAIWNSIVPDTAEYPQRHYASCDVCELAALERRPGDNCPRCGSRLDRNILVRWVPAAACIAAAIPLCIPAYSAAIMVSDSLTGILEHTILGTVQLLADRGYWEVGAVVLIAGVFLPAVELVGIVWLLARVRIPNVHGLVRRTRVYRILYRLVRWPMIIPFIAALAAPIVKFKGIDDVIAGPGATPLFAVIGLLMLAVRFFEPKMMWRTAGVPAEDRRLAAATA